jgi:hypothetical protein
VLNASDHKIPGTLATEMQCRILGTTTGTGLRYPGIPCDHVCDSSPVARLKHINRLARVMELWRPAAMVRTWGKLKR